MPARDGIGIPTSFLVREHLPRVHDPVGVEQFLDLSHPLDARLILTVSQRARFGVPDAMFGRNGSIIRSLGCRQCSLPTRHALHYVPTSSDTNGSRAAVISGVYPAATMLRCMLPEQKISDTNIPRRQRSRTISEMTVAYNVLYCIFVKQSL